LDPKPGVDAGFIGEKLLAPETIETELERGVCRQEGPERDPEHEPRRSSEEGGCPAVVDERGDGERDGRHNRSDKGRDDVVHSPKRLVRVDFEDVRRRRAKSLQSPSDPVGSP
jgi:hypothetical protein